MPTDPTKPMNLAQRAAAEAEDQAAHEEAATNPAPPDPTARLRAAMDALSHSTTLDLHDRLVAHANALKAIAEVMLKGS